MQKERKNGRREERENERKGCITEEITKEVMPRNDLCLYCYGLTRIGPGGPRKKERKKEYF